MSALKFLTNMTIQDARDLRNANECIVLGRPEPTDTRTSEDLTKEGLVSVWKFGDGTIKWLEIITRRYGVS